MDTVVLVTVEAGEMPTQISTTQLFCWHGENQLPNHQVWEPLANISSRVQEGPDYSEFRSQIQVNHPKLPYIEVTLRHFPLIVSSAL